MRKMNIYIIQYAPPSSRNLLPLSAGLLYSSAKSDAVIDQRCRLHLVTERAEVETALEVFDNPALLAFSAYIWNMEQSLRVAESAKRIWPGVVVVFGGPSAQALLDNGQAGLRRAQCVDLVVEGEGETAFRGILHQLMGAGRYSEVPGTYSKRDGQVVAPGKASQEVDLSAQPSPYLDGTFDALLAAQGEKFTGMLLETNRGCPYQCAYCYWGKRMAKVRCLPLVRVFAELEWASANKIGYIFIADANFGLFDRDVEIARKIARLKSDTGYPRWVHIHWLKNSDRRIFEIAETLRQGGLPLIIDYALQSMTPETLKAIGRSPVEAERLESFVGEAEARGFDVISDVIVGLPGESYESFRAWLGLLLLPRLNYFLRVFLCIVLPGTRMADDDYLLQHGIRTRDVPLVHVSSSAGAHGSVMEIERYVVETSACSGTDLERTLLLAFFVKVMHFFRAGFYVLQFLRREHGVDGISFLEHALERLEDSEIGHLVVTPLRRQAENIRNGRPYLQVPYGSSMQVYPEVDVLLSIVRNRGAFYDCLGRLTREYLEARGQECAETLLEDVLRYQAASQRSWERTEETVALRHDLLGYFQRGEPLRGEQNVVCFLDDDPVDTVDRFIESILWGRMVLRLRRAASCPPAAAASSLCA